MNSTVMRCLGFAFLFGFTLPILAEEPDKEKAIKDELKKLEGDWKVIGAEADGKPLKEDLPPKFTFAGNKFTGFAPDATFTIDPTKKPKYLTIVAKVRDKDIPVNAIYELENDQLKIGIPLVEKGKGPDNKRPESFETTGKPIFVFTAKKVASEKK